MNNGFHLRLQLVRRNGSISSDRGISWPAAYRWYRREAAKQFFPHLSVKVFLCVSNAEGHLTTEDEVMVLGIDNR